MTARRKLSLSLLFLIASSPAAVLSQDCSFNEDGDEVTTCNLVMNVTAFHRCSWKTGQGRTYLWLGGPQIDAQQTFTGGYALVSVTDMGSKEAWMATPPALSTGPEGRCVTFAYSIGQLGVKFLEVLLITYEGDPVEALTNTSIPLNFRPRSLWRRTETTNGLWEEGAITYSTGRQHSIVFSAHPDPDFTEYRGFAAVDDINFNIGPCENDCLFDQDLCSWSNAEDDDDFDWSLGRTSGKPSTGPARDQPSSFDPNVNTGGYAYIDSGAPRQTGDIAKLISAVLQPREDPLCFHFWVNMHGSEVGGLRVIHAPLDESNSTKVLWNVKPDSTSGTDMWYPCQQTVAIDQDTQVVIEASVGSVDAGDIGLDSFRFTKGPCPSLPEGTGVSWGDCTFVSGSCKWQVPFKSPYDCSFLSRVPGRLPDPEGHTGIWYHNTDMYMKFDLNCYANQPRERAALISPTVTEDSCLSFWVFMFTQITTHTHIGALKVVLLYPDKNVTIWRLQNTQHSHWQRAQVPVPASSQPVQVAIEGVQGPKVTGMIGVDDITVFSSTQCSVIPPSASVEEADCTFDSDFCMWKVEEQDLQEGLITDTWHLPSDNRLLHDHTFNADGGGFAYLFSFRSKRESRIRSPKIARDTPYCLSFWFSEIYKDDDAELSITKVREGEEEEVVWSVRQEDLKDPPASDQSPRWRFAQVPIESQPSEYQVIIYGKVYDSSWALDDLTFTPDRTNCKVIPARVRRQPTVEDA